jgi:hypothetical protein
MEPNKLAQAVALLNCIGEIPVSNLGWDSDCTEGFRGFPQSLQANSGRVY